MTMKKKKYSKLLWLAINEHRMSDYAKRLLTPSTVRSMKKIGRQRLTCKK